MLPLGVAMRARCARTEKAQMLGAMLPTGGPSRVGIAWGGLKALVKKKHEKQITGLI